MEQKDIIIIIIALRIADMEWILLQRLKEYLRQTLFKFIIVIIFMYYVYDCVFIWTVYWFYKNRLKMHIYHQEKRTITIKVQTLHGRSLKNSFCNHRRCLNFTQLKTRFLFLLTLYMNMKFRMKFEDAKTCILIKRALNYARKARGHQGRVRIKPWCHQIHNQPY